MKRIWFSRSGKILQIGNSKVRLQIKMGIFKGNDHDLVRGSKNPQGSNRGWREQRREAVVRRVLEKAFGELCTQGPPHSHSEVWGEWLPQGGWESSISMWWMLAGQSGGQGLGWGMFSTIESSPCSAGLACRPDVVRAKHCFPGPDGLIQKRDPSRLISKKGNETPTERSHRAGATEGPGTEQGSGLTEEVLPQRICKGAREVWTVHEDRTVADYTWLSLLTPELKVCLRYRERET